MNILHFCADGIRNAEHEIAVERLAGNIVKEEHWKGEACAYRAVYSAALELSGAPAELQAGTMDKFAVIVATMHENPEHAMIAEVCQSVLDYILHLREDARNVEFILTRGTEAQKKNKQV